jgi:hypothetical protein
MKFTYIDFNSFNLEMSYAKIFDRKYYSYCDS